MKNGFTIIELMLTILIVSIVLAIGVPSFTAAIQNNRIAGQINTLLSTLNYARAEAVKLGNTTVTICGSTDQAGCDTSNWESGWIVFRDVNGNGSVEAGDTILRVQEALTGGNTLRTNGFAAATHIQFGNRGTTGQQGTFTLCDSRGATEARGTVINLSGQARSASDDNNPADDIVNLHSGGNVTCP